MARNLLLTGPPGCGKTTVIRRVIERLGDRRLAGFYTEEIRQHGRRLGFRAVGLGGSRQVLAHVDFSSRYRVGRYGVDLSGFEDLFETEISKAEGEVDLFVVDEIGKMECFSNAFASSRLPHCPSLPSVMSSLGTIPPALDRRHSDVMPQLPRCRFRHACLCAGSFYGLAVGFVDPTRAAGPHFRLSEPQSVRSKRASPSAKNALGGSREATPKLRALCRSLKKFAAAQDSREHVLSSILEVRSTNSLRNLSTPEAVKGTVHSLASWILAFSHNGDGYGFPFNVPYLTLYDRILEVDKVLREVGANWSVKKRGPLGTLKRLKEILDIVVASKHTAEFRRIVTEMKRDQGVFEQLRDALRICPKGGTQRRNDDGVSNLLNPSCHKAVLKDLRRSLKRKASFGQSSVSVADYTVGGTFVAT